MAIRQTPTKAGLAPPVAGMAASLAVLALVFGLFSPPPAAGAQDLGNAAGDEIWKLEVAYFTNLYRADHAGVLALVHPQFLGWPGNLPKPIGRSESAQFMKRLIPQPTPCAIRIERAGLQRSGDTALSQYTLHVKCPEASGTVKTQSSRITHTWTKQKGQWKLLGGMSVDVKEE